jgi:enoyl-[acyl-carrier-protein] reductase (NADH)
MGLAKASLESCVRFLAADLGPKGIRVNAISQPSRANAAAIPAAIERSLATPTISAFLPAMKPIT